MQLFLRMLWLGWLSLGGLCLQDRAMAHETSSELAIIVAHGAGPDLSKREEIAQVFLARRKIDRTGRALVPVNLPPDDPVRQVFSQQILGAPPKAWEAYWTERYFQGVTPPAVVASPEAVLRFVAATPGAVGYLPVCRVDGRVRVLLRVEAPPALARSLAATCAP
jgi:hypothetical protein